MRKLPASELAIMRGSAKRPPVYLNSDGGAEGGASWFNKTWNVSRVKRSLHRHSSHSLGAWTQRCSFIDTFLEYFWTVELRLQVWSQRARSDAVHSARENIEVGPLSGRIFDNCPIDVEVRNDPFLFLYDFLMTISGPRHPSDDVSQFSASNHTIHVWVKVSTEIGFVKWHTEDGQHS